MANERIVYFAHDQESEAWGPEIKHLAEVAEELNFAVESPDYSGIKSFSGRVAKLLSLKPTASEQLILVGSRVGSWVPLCVSETLKPQGLFLVAPAVGIKDFEPISPKSLTKNTLLIHGWQDEVVPVENVINFARQYQVSLHLLPSDHRLTDQLDWLAILFRNFLQQCLKSNKDKDPRSQWEKEQEAKFQKETIKQIQSRIPR
jgi:hypothetical protein